MKDFISHWPAIFFLGSAILTAKLIVIVTNPPGENNPSREARAFLTIFINRLAFFINIFLVILFFTTVVLIIIEEV